MPLQRCSKVSARSESYYIAAARFRQGAKAITSLQQGFGKERKPLHRCSKVSARSEGHYIAAARFRQKHHIGTSIA
jgi:hypothetical protein